MMRTVFFDLGNVLIFFSFQKMLNQVASCTGLDPKRVHELFQKEQMRQAYETGKITSEDLYQKLLSLSPRSFSLDELLDAASNIFTPHPEIWPIVQELKEKGNRLVLLSNTCECHFNRAYSLTPNLKLFDDFVLSYQVGAAKPDREIFLKALSLANCPKEECFYTDDIPEFIQSAKQCGLKGALFTNVPTLRSHLQKENLL